MDAEDAELLALLAKGLDRYYEQLVSKYWQQLRRFVFRQTGSWQDAEDIAQETVVRAYLALGGYPSQRILALKVRPWLYKITWNSYCNYAGRSNTALVVPLDLSDESAFLEREDDQRERPEVVFENAERRRELEALVCTLPQRYREIVNLYYFEELSHQEIADIVHAPVTTVRVYLHRGIHLLRKHAASQMSEVSGNNGR
jgi:RNA polymerase sigma-70 factor, ECF subfamily